ncbi:MAG: 2-oxoglutarate oxidoreductase [Candidatus Latescibacteria bacterium]|nr:2-oxoglutarate oxidoreductase [Candidatus Latescibacterota bacterium]MCK5329625.1 2-oxoglutarate oxidoreductase [Candidatus Latescibacterota bacterium]MCK5525874.1 2-oxoglutarate oxidoreductase [Candidatus Latescibacterota bacterium]
MPPSTRNNKRTFRRPESLTDIPFRYCPGCGHGIVARLLAEVVDELGIRERTIGLAPVGCAIWLENHFEWDTVGPAHGRGPAVATGIKRVLPDHVLLSYQGDGDLAAIGTAEMIHAANRGECITVIFVNNAVYGMTQGQMAPTTMLGQETVTTPGGRDAKRDGFPLRVCELLSSLEGAVYLTRTTITSPKHVHATKRAIRKAIELQMQGAGFTLVEVLSTCPTNWRMNPLQAMEWIEKEMASYYPLGEIKGT